MLSLQSFWETYGYLCMELMLCIHTYCAKIYGHPPDSSPR